MVRFVPLLDAPEPALARLVERRNRRRGRRQITSGAGVTTSLARLVGAVVWVVAAAERPVARYPLSDASPERRYSPSRSRALDQFAAR